MITGRIKENIRQPIRKWVAFLCIPGCDAGRSVMKFPELPERGNCAGPQHYLSIAAVPNFKG
jgi:hypothetical protein